MTPRPREQVLTADPDGDGCAETLLWDGRVLRRADDRRQRYVIGDRGDHLLLGDWDCDGADTAALYRPATGQIFLFDRWAVPGKELASGPGKDTGVVHGRAQVRPSLEGCDGLVVRQQRAGQQPEGGRAASGS